MQELQMVGPMVVTDLEDMSAEEGNRYREYVAQQCGGSLENVKSIKVFDCGNGEVNIHWTTEKNTPFERIRRITGYLVGTIDRWNDAKRAEESERVKHTPKYA